MKKLYLFVYSVVSLVVLSGCSPQETDGTFYNIFVKPLDIFMEKIYSVTGNWGITLIIITLVIRGIIFPFIINNYKNQAKTSKNMKRAKPELDEVQNKIKVLKDKERLTPNNNEKMEIRRNMVELQREVFEVYKKYDCNPLSSFKNMIPMLIQAPFLTGIYFVLQNPIYSSGLRNANFLGLDLGEKSLVIIILVFCVYVAVSKVSVSMAKRQSEMSSTVGNEEMNKTMQQSAGIMMWITPFFISFITYSNISAIGIYFIVGGFIAILQIVVGKKLYPIESSNNKNESNTKSKVKLVKK